MKFKKLSILMPVYNEENSVYGILVRILKCQLKYALDKEIIIVDDCSNDGTAQIVAGFLREYNNSYNIRFIRSHKNEGKGASIRKALEKSTGDIIVFQDADLEYDPQDYNLMLEPIITQDADVVYGSRFLKGERRNSFSFQQALANKLLTFFTNICTGVRLSDMETCYKMFKAPLIKSLSISSSRFEIEPEITIKLVKRGVKIHEVPINYNSRWYQEGKKIGWRDGFKAIGTIIKYSIRK
jgi:glycosyltransferase involved in cell wall biosynthesis